MRHGVGRTRRGFRGLVESGVAAVVLILAAGCAMTPVTEPVSPTGSGPMQAELDAARAKWAAASPAVYRFELTRSCFCLPEFTGPFRVEVAGGQVIEVVHLELGAEVDADRGESIEGLFALLQRAITEGAVEIRAAYDPVLGHPTDLYVDRDRRIADEEIGYRVRDLVILSRT
ncbi:MAG: DUF6174 domain-containing protein [Acidimicrobiales bacterium]